MYRNPFVSMMTSSVMMLGSMEYVNIWVDPVFDDTKDPLMFANLSFVMLGLFIILIPILLMNLLVSGIYVFCSVMIA